MKDALGKAIAKKPSAKGIRETEKRAVQKQPPQNLTLAPFVNEEGIKGMREAVRRGGN